MPRPSATCDVLILRVQRQWDIVHSRMLQENGSVLQTIQVTETQAWCHGCLHDVMECWVEMMKSVLMILLAYITCVCEMHSNDRMYDVCVQWIYGPLLRFPDLPGDPLKYCNASAGCNESAYLQLLSRTSWYVGVMSCQKAVEMLILQHGCVFGGKSWGSLRSWDM